MTAASNVTRDWVRWFFLGATVVFIGLFAAYFLLGFLEPDSPILGSGSDDQPIEYLGAFFWVAASAICAFRLIKGEEPRLLLAMWMVLTFLFFGEEISWFQRILGFDTPEAIMEINAQGEFNLHNLEGLGIGSLGTQNLFRLGFFAYFLVLPVLTLSTRLRTWAGKVGYVAPGRGFLIMVWGVVVASAILQVVGPPEARRVTVETRESFYAFAVLVYVYLYLRSDALPVESSTETSAGL